MSATLTVKRRLVKPARFRFPHTMVEPKDLVFQPEREGAMNL
jgi:hypothetical protein